jgi:hypothetical protein
MTIELAHHYAATAAAACASATPAAISWRSSPQAPDRSPWPQAIPPFAG